MSKESNLVRCWTRTVADLGEEVMAPQTEKRRGQSIFWNPLKSDQNVGTYLENYIQAGLAFPNYLKFSYNA